MATITLYSVNSTSKIRAIQTLRAIATLRGAKLGLRAAKMLVDDLPAFPVLVDVADHEQAIVTMALRQHFTMDPPEQAQPRSLALHFEYDHPEYDCPDDDPDYDPTYRPF